MISKAKFIEIYLLKSDFDVKDIAKMVYQAEEAYEKIVVSSDDSTHSRALQVLGEYYNHKLTYMEKQGNGINPVWAKSETDELRSIWDTFEFLRKVTMENEGIDDNKYGGRIRIGKRL